MATRKRSGRKEAKFSLPVWGWVLLALVFLASATGTIVLTVHVSKSYKNSGGKIIDFEKTQK